MATAGAAKDSIVKAFIDAWAASAFSAVPVAYDSQILEDGTTPTASNAWVRFNVQHAPPSEPEAFGDGKKLYPRKCFLSAQIFKPKGSAAFNLDTMGQVIVLAFAGKQTPQGVFTKNVYIMDSAKGVKGAEDVWDAVTVYGEATYDELI
jgi:hypothetical protein